MCGQSSGQEKKKAVLPEVAAAPVQAADVLRVAPVRAADGAGQTGFVGRHGQQVDVVGHEAVAEDGDAGRGAVVAEEVEVDAAVVVGEEDVLVVVAALGDVVRAVRNDDTSVARHGVSVLPCAGIVKKIGGCPSFSHVTKIGDCPYLSR